MYIDRLNERYKQQASAYYGKSRGGWESSSTDWDRATLAGEVEVIRGE